MNNSRSHLPRIVSHVEWQAAHDQFLMKEKAATVARDALAAQRRRLPMVKIEKIYNLAGVNGTVSLADLFESSQQLILIHFMFAPDWEEGCIGCSMTVDSLCNLAHLHARNTTVALVSRAPLAKLTAFKRRMGWVVPWYSSHGSDFNADFGATLEGEEQSLVSVFLRNGNDVFRTYYTSNRGDEMLGTPWSYLDLTPLGRQETWEDAPSGALQTPPYEWWRHHDRYDASPKPMSCCHGAT
jgi:predicted dithiol-disulfide oxidoreductase (DUF899 family)